MISWQLMNFSQTESKVRLYCGLRSRHRKDQGLREGVVWPFQPPSEAYGSPSPRLFSTCILQSVQHTYSAATGNGSWTHSQVQVSL